LNCGFFDCIGDSPDAAGVKDPRHDVSPWSEALTHEIKTKSGPTHQIQGATPMKQPQLFLINREPDVAKIVRDAADKYRCELFEAEESETALRILKEHGPRFSLVIISLDPEIHGLTLVAGIKDCCEAVPVIALTDATHTGEAQALAYGAVKTIPKPVDAAQLQEIVRRFCSSQHSSAA